MAITLVDHSGKDGTGDAINGSEVDENTTTLNNVLNGVTGTALNDTALMNFTITPYVLDHKNLRVRVYNNSGGALAAGDYLYISAYNSTQTLYEVTKAIVTTSPTTTLYAQLIADAAISNAAAGNATMLRPLTGLDTSGLTVGRPVFLSTTAGGWTGTLPAAGTCIQIVGHVAVVNATTGRIIQCVGSVIPWSLADQV